MKTSLKTLALVLPLLFVLASCDKMDMCYYEDDFGETGNRDIVYVAAGAENCYFDQTVPYTDSSQNMSVRQCLTTTDIKTALDCDSNCSSYFKKIKTISGYSGTISDATKCNNFDPNTYTITEANTNSSTNTSYNLSDAVSDGQAIYSSCVSYCQDSCDNNNSSEVAWVKANMKNGASYTGLQLSKNSYVYITVSGSIQLSSGENSNTAEFRKVGIDDISHGQQLSSGSYLSLKMDYNNGPSVLGTSGIFSDEQDLKNRTVVYLEPINTDLVDSSDSNNEYKYQKPLYSLLKCKYYSKGNGTSNNATCSFDFSDVTGDFQSKLSAYYSSQDYNSSIFYDGYSTYANDAMNYLKMSSDGSVYSESSNVSVSNNKEIIYGDMVDGYIWNDENTSFNFTINEPTKIAIRYIGLGSSGTCKLKAETTNNYVYGSTASTTEGGETKYVKNEATEYVVANDYTITQIGNSNTNVWQVLKTNLATEANQEVKDIIFNQFSTPNRKIASTVTLTLDNGSGADCHKGMLIKLIPLKDYVVGKTGLLFFSYIGINDISSNIQYNVVNPDVLVTSKTLTDPTIKVRDFVEYGNPRSFGEWHELSPVSTSDISNIDDDSYNDGVINKSVFVRSGQILRFDYKNWFKIDDETGISMISGTCSGSSCGDSSSPFSVDKTIATNFIIRERPAYFCVGKRQEAVDVETKCAESNGTYYDSVNIDNVTSSKCFVSVKECEADTDLVKTFLKINDTDINCTSKGKGTNTSTSTSDEDTETDLSMQLSKLFSSVYNAYMDALYHSTTNYEYEDEDGKTVTKTQMRYSTCYNDILEKIYRQAKECATCLNTGSCTLYNKDKTSTHEDNSGSYEVYKDTDYTYNDESGDETKEVTETVKTVHGISNISFDESATANIIGTGGVIETLKNFFAVEEIKKTTYNDEETISYNATMTYYKKMCGSSEDGVCLTDNSVSLCYDLTDYIGSTVGFVNRTLDNVNDSSINIGTIESRGTMGSDDVDLGASRMAVFNGTKGTMANFVKDTDTTDDNSVSNGYTRLTNSGTTYVNNTSLLGVFMLKTIKNKDSISNDEIIKTYFKPDVSGNTIIKIQSDSIPLYTNGEKLEVILGEDKINGNNTKYYSKGDDKVYYGTDTEVSSDNSAPYRIIDIVRLNNSKSQYKFNASGNLIHATNLTEGIDFSSLYFEDFFDDNSDKNLFFKILDEDGNSSNNSGTYRVVIKEYGDSDSKIISFFREFFNKFLGFVDGEYFRLLRTVRTDDKGNKVIGDFIECEDPSDGAKCYIYDSDAASNSSLVYGKNNSNNNGKKCRKGDGNCYKTCDLSSVKENEKCVTVHDGNGFVKGVYLNFINDPLYIFIAKISLILAISWYGFGYFFGYSNFTQSEIIPKLIKVCFIYFVISPSGWNFFNKYFISFFKNAVDSVLFLIAGSFETDLGSELLLAINSGDYSDKTVLFTSCFDNLEMIFSTSMFSKIVGLAFSGWIGLIYLYLALSAVIDYIVAVLTAMVMYLSAQVYMSIVFCFFPLVVLFMFFKKTEKTFDNWLGLLIGFAGQQIFLVMTLSFFNLLVYNFIRNTFSYTVCWLSIFNLNVAGIPLASIQFWKIPSTSMSSSGISAVTNGGMPSFYSIITLYMVGTLMGKFITEMTGIGSSIFGGMGIGNGALSGKITGAIKGAGEGAKNFMKKTGEDFYSGMAERFGGKALRELDEDQKKDMADRRGKRNEHFKGVNKKTAEDMEDYKENFAKDKAKDVAKRDAFNEMVSKESVDKDKKKEEENNRIINDKNSTEEQRNKAKSENADIAKRNGMREQYNKNQEAIEKGKSAGATEEDKAAAKRAEEANRQLVEQNYNSLSEDEREKREDQALKSDEVKNATAEAMSSENLSKKQKEFEHKNQVESVMNNYDEEMKKAFIKSGGSEEKYESMSDDEKFKMAESYGRAHGLVGKIENEDKKDSGESGNNGEIPDVSVPDDPKPEQEQKQASEYEFEQDSESKSEQEQKPESE